MIDHFEFTLGHQCAANALTLITPTPNLPDFTVPALTPGTHSFTGHQIDVTFTASDNTCSFTKVLQVYDEPTNTWNDHSVSIYSAFITAYDSASGAWTLSVPSSEGPGADPIDGDPTVVRLRYVLGDANSNSGSSTVYDEFSITVNYDCSTDSLSIATGSDVQTVTYTVGDAPLLAPLVAGSVLT